ncbi:MAG: HAD family phosphatase [Bacteroidota bacterium]|nr:HAD family phosphatase [Ferruginibacter sp.]
MAAIKNIIFDLGGVLLNIDYKKTSRAFTDLGVAGFDDLYSQVTANHLFEALETGEISDEAFYAEMAPHCAPDTSVLQMQQAWNRILLDFREGSLEFLKQLRERYNIYLLSNTNSIHLQEFNRILQAQTGEASLDEFFTKSYYSHIMKKRKPYPETYKWVLDDAGIEAEETLFIDDSINNIKGAMVAGLQTHLLLPNEKIEDLGLL